VFSRLACSSSGLRYWGMCPGPRGAKSLRHPRPRAMLAASRSGPGGPAAGSGAGEDAAGATVDRAHRRGRGSLCYWWWPRSRDQFRGRLAHSYCRSSARWSWQIPWRLPGSSRWSSEVAPTAEPRRPSADCWSLRPSCSSRTSSRSAWCTGRSMAEDPRGVWSTPRRTPTVRSPRPPPRDYRPGLAAAVPRPPIPVVHKRRGVQPHRDTLPLTIRVKGLMALQSVISLAVLVVVLARVINILPS
jgi:hypothetical protein